MNLKLCHLKSNDCKEFQEFFRKFGPKLRKIDSIECFNDLNLFPKLQILDLDIDRFQLDDIIKLNLIRVNRLKLIVGEGKEFMFRKVLKKFNEIRHLTLDLKTFNEMTVFNALQDSPIIYNLKELEVRTKRDQRCDSIINCLKQMTKKFPNLKRIEFFYISHFVFSKNSSDFEQIMSSLKAFPRLKRLQLRLHFMNDLEFEKKLFIQIFSSRVDSFKN